MLQKLENVQIYAVRGSFILIISQLIEVSVFPNFPIPPKKQNSIRDSTLLLLQVAFSCSNAYYLNYFLLTLSIYFQIFGLSFSF